MKKLAILLIAVVGLFSGCVAYEVQDRDGGVRHLESDRDRGGDRAGDRADRDRDRDGVPNRQDRRPDEPRRY